MHAIDNRPFVYKCTHIYINNEDDTTHSLLHIIEEIDVLWFISWY